MERHRAGGGAVRSANGPVARVLGYCAPYAGRLVCAVLCMALSALFGVIPPWLIKNVVDDVLIARDSAALNMLALSVVGLYALKAIFGYGHTYLMSWVGQRVIVDIRLELYDKTQRLPLSRLYSVRTGEFLSRITNDVSTLQNILSSVIIDLVVQSVTFIGILCFILYINWRLTLWTFAAIPFAAAAIDRAASRLRRVGGEIQEQLAHLASIAQEAISSVRTVRAFATERAEFDRFAAQSQTHFRALISGTKTRGVLEGVVEVILISALALILWLGGRDVVEGRSTAGDLIAFLTYIGLLVQPVRVISRVVSTMQQGAASAERIFEILDEPDEMSEPDDAVVLNDMRGEIEFRGVSFAYSGEAGAPGRLVLDKIDLRVSPGEKVAIVGPTGAGKSTVADLILRFYDPTEGSILIDGVDLRELSLSAYRRRVGVVPQDPVLMKGTFAYNISYGARDATTDDIEKAARSAGIAEFIEGLPDRYESEIGERGVTLSGGQRQRVAIARAVVRDPSILIMDEATSSLDTLMESQIQSAMDGAMHGRTSIVIAHRLSTIRSADRIIVLSDGHIAESGTHDELIAKSGIYRALYEAQSARVDSDESV